MKSSGDNIEYWNKYNIRQKRWYAYLYKKFNLLFTKPD